jgi:hypothetical protein
MVLLAAYSPYREAELDKPRYLLANNLTMYDTLRLHLLHRESKTSAGEGEDFS